MYLVVTMRDVLYIYILFDVNKSKIPEVVGIIQPYFYGGY